MPGLGSPGIRFLSPVHAGENILQTELHPPTHTNGFHQRIAIIERGECLYNISTHEHNVLGSHSPLLFPAPIRPLSLPTPLIASFPGDFRKQVLKK